MQRGELLGSLEHVVLLALACLDGTAHGTLVRREIEARTGRDISIGAVYATLDRLEQKGLIASTRVAGDGGSRRVFSVTAAGTRALYETRSVRDRLWQGLDVRLVGAKSRA